MRKNNTVVLGDENEVYSKELTAYDLNFISIDKLEEPMRVKAKYVIPPKRLMRLFILLKTAKSGLCLTLPRGLLLPGSR